MNEQCNYFLQSILFGTLAWQNEKYNAHTHHKRTKVTSTDNVSLFTLAQNKITNSITKFMLIVVEIYEIPMKLQNS